MILGVEPNQHHVSDFDNSSSDSSSKGIISKVESVPGLELITNCVLILNLHYFYLGQCSCTAGLSEASQKSNVELQISNNELIILLIF